MLRDLDSRTAIQMSIQFVFQMCVFTKNMKHSYFVIFYYTNKIRFLPKTHRYFHKTYTDQWDKFESP